MVCASLMSHCSAHAQQRRIFRSAPVFESCAFSWVASLAGLLKPVMIRAVMLSAKLSCIQKRCVTLAAGLVTKAVTTAASDYSLMCNQVWLLQAHCNINRLSIRACISCSKICLMLKWWNGTSLSIRPRLCEPELCRWKASLIWNTWNIFMDPW